MNFTTIPSNTYELGWRFANSLPEDTLKKIDEFITFDDLMQCFSPHRTVTLAAFEIATTTIGFQDLFGNPSDLEEGMTIEALCTLIDEKLALDDLRLPTEDELEAAAGGALFPWGMEIPDGIPYGSETSFVAHKQPNSFGLVLKGDPYCGEICRHAIIFGDGGSAICGGYPWPFAWLSLSPAFRVPSDSISECLPETLEMVYIRPVKRVP
jgi:hypothetical protein